MRARSRYTLWTAWSALALLLIARAASHSDYGTGYSRRVFEVAYHGAFAPRGRCHSGPVVVEHAPSPATTAANGSPGAAAEAAAPPAAYVRPRHFAWADLLRRVFAFDVLACPDCGGRLRLLATIEERAVVEKILTHLGLAADPPCPSPARTPAWLPGVRAAADHEDHAGGHWPN
jgi:hypothetical protein